jgi:hypothetical protein
VYRSLNCFFIALGLSQLCLGQASPPNAENAKPPFTFQEVMIPMRDGVRLQTVILTPAGQNKPLPILLQRTPYGSPDKAPEAAPDNWKELMADGYVFVSQNLRGRFKSEGTFHLSSFVNLADAKATNETTDAYDTIEWLVKNVRKHKWPRRHPGRIVLRTDCRNDSPAPASGIKGRFRAGFTRGSVDER